MLCLFLAGFLLHRHISKDKDDIKSEIKTVVFLTSAVAFLTPLLQSLTVSYASDTIAVLTACFVVLHCFGYDFQIGVSSKAYVRSATSLNAIFFAAILISSRLQRISSVFILLSTNLLIFGFGPHIRDELRRLNVLYFEALTLAQTLCMVCLIFCCSHLMCILYVCFVLIMAFGVPLLFIYAYSFKNDVRGPWDLPKVRDYHHLD